MSTTTMGASSTTVNNKCRDFGGRCSAQPAGRRVSITDTDIASEATGARWSSSSKEVRTHSKNSVSPNVAIRFTLRKRAVIDDRREVNLSSCNSEFLSDLFADIANANAGEEELFEDDSRLDSTKSVKKCRVSLSRSISRCGKSFANLSFVTDTPSQDPNMSPTAVNLFHSPVTTVNGPCISNDMPVTNTWLSRNISVSYQHKSHRVSSSSSNDSEVEATAHIGDVAFPYLPATVSNSSCNNLSSLTRSNSGRPLSDTESPMKDCYGWFVETDEDVAFVADSVVSAIKAYNTTISAADLAFSAMTAPKRSDYDAELEWAQAADTVDDVLGDFF